MEHGSAENIGMVFVDNGKGGAVHHIAYPELLAQSLDKCGLSGAHGTVEGKDTVHIDGSEKLVRRALNVIQR